LKEHKSLRHLKLPKADLGGLALPHTTGEPKEQNFDEQTLAQRSPGPFIVWTEKQICIAAFRWQ